MVSKLATSSNLLLAPPRKWNDRKSLAKLISELYFPISHRTLEKWPLEWKLVNGRALGDTHEALAHAEKMLSGAVQIRGNKP